MSRRNSKHVEGSKAGSGQPKLRKLAFDWAFGADFCEDDAELFIRRMSTVRHESVEFRKTLPAKIT